VGIIVSSLMLGGEAAQGAVLNPAIAFGLNLITIEALIAPLIGSIVGMWLFVMISEDARSIWKKVASSFRTKPSEETSSPAEAPSLASDSH